MQLLGRGERVKAIVRSPESMPIALRNHPLLTIIRANLLDLSDAEMVEHVQGCNAVASCLGHNLTFKGLFGQPRRLVTDATRRLCQAIIVSEANQTSEPIKFVLMNTAGNSNRNLNEPISTAQKGVIGLLRALLPPHVDNEQAADYLRTEIGQKHERIEWVVVRPDGLVNEEQISEYTLHPSPTRSAIFNAGTTSRINVAHFMATLISDEQLWREWRGNMPVIYNHQESIP